MQLSRRNARVVRSWTLRFTHALVLSATMLLLLSAHADAQGRRARLSHDLVERLGPGDTSATSVIVTGTPQRVAAIAARHGLRIRKRLQSGAVLDVPAGHLRELADDGTLDQLSS